MKRKGGGAWEVALHIFYCWSQSAQRRRWSASVHVLIAYLLLWGEKTTPTTLGMICCTHTLTHTRKRGGTTEFFFFLCVRVERRRRSHPKQKQTERHPEEHTRVRTEVHKSVHGFKKEEGCCWGDAAGDWGDVREARSVITPTPPRGASVHFDGGKVC